MTTDHEEVDRVMRRKPEPPDPPRRRKLPPKPDRVKKLSEIQWDVRQRMDELRPVLEEQIKLEAMIKVIES